MNEQYKIIVIYWYIFIKYELTNSENNSVFKDINDGFSILFYPITLGGRRGTTGEFATIVSPVKRWFTVAIIIYEKTLNVSVIIS